MDTINQLKKTKTVQIPLILFILIKTATSGDLHITSEDLQFSKTNENKLLNILSVIQENSEMSLGELIKIQPELTSVFDLLLLVHTFSNLSKPMSSEELLYRASTFLMLDEWLSKSNGESSWFLRYHAQQKIKSLLMNHVILYGNESAQPLIVLLCNRLVVDYQVLIRTIEEKINKSISIDYFNMPTPTLKYIAIYYKLEPMMKDLNFKPFTNVSPKNLPWLMGVLPRLEKQKKYLTIMSEMSKRMNEPLEKLGKEQLLGVYDSIKENQELQIFSGDYTNPRPESSEYVCSGIKHMINNTKMIQSMSNQSKPTPTPRWPQPTPTIQATPTPKR